MTPQEREVMQMALDVLDDINQCSLPPTGIPLPAEIDEAMDSLRAALAQPPCATGAQCVEWVGLTSEERLALWNGLECDLECMKPAQYAEAIEAKLKEKNNG